MIQDSQKEDIELGHHCDKCGKLASVYVCPLELGSPEPADETICLCNEHGAQGVLESVRGMAHG